MTSNFPIEREKPMKAVLKLAAVLAALTVFTGTADAKRYHHRAHHHKTYRIQASAFVASAGNVNNDNPRAVAAVTPSQETTEHYSRDTRSAPDGRATIPNPSGCNRVALSCACRLAAYWGLGKGLDKVSTWPKVFTRVSSPGVGIAAVRHSQHHIIGIIGGGPGAWRVVDFNSGRHQNHEYTVADFHGYFFVDPRVKVAAR